MLKAAAFIALLFVVVMLPPALGARPACLIEPASPKC